MKVEFSRNLRSRWMKSFFPGFAIGTIILLFPAQILIGGTKISAGSGHSLALQTDGTVWAWGLNLGGQLGDGTRTNRLSPVRVADLTNIIAVAAGLFHSLALKADGTVWAWGENGYGQLGDGTGIGSRIPVQVRGLYGVVAVAAGGGHSLALKADGSVWAWGFNRFGQLGDGTTDQFKNSPVQVLQSTGLSGIVAVAAGTAHSLALGANGSVFAWGLNEYGQLGEGDNVNRNYPVGVGPDGIVALAAGYSHSLLLKEDGTVWACGDNRVGQLGNGTWTSRNWLAQVSGLSSIVSISSEFMTSFALKADGTVWGWGYNKYNYQLGYTAGLDINLPVKINISGVADIASGGEHVLALKGDGSVWAWGLNWAGHLGNGSGLISPLPVQSLFSQRPESYTMISGGQQHSFALKPGAGGTVRAWGANPFGQLGDGTFSDSHSPVLVKSLTDVKTIASDGGAFHTVALKSDGLVWAWGLNVYGQLGDGTTVNSPSPKQVAGLDGVSSVAEGYMHTLALINGGIRAWGWNEHGQLGSNSDANSPLPVSVSGLNDVKFISGGSRHSLAVRSNGTVWAWGWNEHGQLGDNSAVDKRIPVQVFGLEGVKVVSGGVWFSLALKADGTVWAWGSNAGGQLGDGTGINSLVPVQVSGLDNVRIIAAGADHSLALKADGTVWAWGHNAYGQLGDGTLVTRFSPIQVSDLTNVVVIGCGVENSFAIKADGTVWAWGYNNRGQLGDGTTVMRTHPVQLANDNCAVSATTGSNITVVPIDPATEQTPVTVTFTNVTGGGIVSVNSYSSSVLPANFRLSTLQSYSVTTTAEYNGYIDICIKYDQPPVGVNESYLRLWHYWDVNLAAGKLPGVDPYFDYSKSGWENVTKAGSPDTTNHVICGTVTCLSPFIIGMPIAITGPTAPVPVSTQTTLSAPYNGETSAEWDFGDGTLEPGTISGDTWIGAHTYSTPGTYSIRLSLVDAGGALVGQAEYRIVIYDSSGGFVTGGGWIDSPAGALSAHPDLAGKANFSFEAKYQKKTTTPSGNLEFQFKEGGLTFKAKAIDWLVVAGAKAQFKGTGTINGAGSYRFLITVIDGDVPGGGGSDLFRIRIWDAAGGGLIYDNEVGKDENGDPATVIAAGSIVIHK